MGHEKGEIVGWWDVTMDAWHWFSLPDIGPREAAMLLARYNPHNQNACDSWPNSWTDETSISDHKRLIRWCESIGGSRALIEWHRMAKEAGYTVNSWIDQYVECAFPEASSAPPAAAVVAPSAPPASAHPSKRTRRDAVTPAIERAQRQCQEPDDVAQVWSYLQEMARKGEPPFIGTTEDGLKWVDANDKAAFLSRDALRRRMRRARSPSVR